MVENTQAAQEEFWSELTSTDIEFNSAGRIVDYLNKSTTRPDTKEERVRQYYARVLVEEYNYAKEHIVIEAPINIGSETRQADIVIYHSANAASARDQGQIKLIVETKAPDKSRGRCQLTSYIFSSSAEGGVWTNGDHAAYFRRISTPVSQLQAWPNIPRSGETWDTVGHYEKSQLNPPKDLKQVFRRCHNAIYRAGLDSEDVALDMVRILLAKYRDEQNPGEKCRFRCTPEEFMSEEGRQSVAARIHYLFSQVVQDHPDVFPPEERITIGATNLSVVVNELQPFTFLNDDDVDEVYDVIGTAFEVYVAAHLKGARGQYFTNRLVVNMMIQALDPSEHDVVYDPACGSGGFLIAALRHIRKKIATSDRTKVAKEADRKRIGRSQWVVIPCLWQTTQGATTCGLRSPDRSMTGWACATQAT